MDRYSEFKQWEQDAQDMSVPLVTALDDASSNLNHLQLATTIFAYKNMEKQKHQMWVVYAGQGKSRIHVALTFAILKFARQKVYVVFQNERLKKRDEKQNDRLIKFAKTCGLEWDKYVTYQTSTKIDEKTKKGVMILDEADTLIFSDAATYFNNTNYKNLKIVGLTATPFHGNEAGIEKACLNLMNFKVYRNC